MRKHFITKIREGVKTQSDNFCENCWILNYFWRLQLYRVRLQRSKVLTLPLDTSYILIVLSLLATDNTCPKTKYLYIVKMICEHKKNIFSSTNVKIIHQRQSNYSNINRNRTCRIKSNSVSGMRATIYADHWSTLSHIPQLYCTVRITWCYCVSLSKNNKWARIQTTQFKSQVNWKKSYGKPHCKPILNFFLGYFILLFPSLQHLYK